MALSSQGFTIKNNLAEAFFDRTIFNNLAGSPQGSDISLLFNNMRNTSVLTVTNQHIVGNSVVIPNAFAVYSNRTQIKVSTSTYYVKNSNGINTFQLSSSPDLVDTVTPVAGNYIRSDAITFENISNFSSQRTPAAGGAEAGLENINISRETSIYDIFDKNLKTLLTEAESNLVFYNFRTLKSLNKKSNFLGNKLLKANGTFIVKDPDGVIQSQGLVNTAPGLFIYNAETNSGIRAFSSTSNPWEESVSYLETTALQITAGKLTISNPSGLVIQKKGSGTLKENVSPAQPVNNTTFTHKVPVTINGELYYLCLKSES